MFLSLSILTTLALPALSSDSLHEKPYTAPLSFMQHSKAVDSIIKSEKLPPPIGKNEASEEVQIEMPDDSSNYIPQSEFTWAGRPRYILDGSQPRRVTDLRPATFFALEGSYLGVLVALHIYQENTFWRNSTSFRVRDNWDESLGANYGGHFVAAYFISYVSTEALLASGFSTKLAPIYGALMGLAYQTYIEVLDGYGINFELSPYEVYSQTLGVVYYLATQYSTFLQNFIPKFNYYPSKWFGELPKNGSETPIDDYSAWNLWFSINIPNLTNHILEPYWPNWLHLAFGYGARNLGDPGEARVVTLALDYDIDKLLPDGSPSWNWFKQTLNFFKFPSPCIEWRFSRDGWKNMGARFYFLYPFRIGNIPF